MKQFLTVLLFLFGLMQASAQDTRTVKGTVLNATGQPLPAVTVSSDKGVTTATKTNGTFEIRVSSNAVLTFSYVGYVTVTETVGNKEEINITLSPDEKSLDQVVVVGYGQTTRRKDLTGSISSVSGAELAKVPVQNVAQALQGRIAGLHVTMGSGDPGEQPSMRLRGGTSITQSNEPLYVVDGVPQEEGLNFIDPMDIETIDVLKDANATAIYGSRGANGVILVTTKKIKVNKTTITYDGYYGVRKTTRYLPVLSPLEYYKYVYEGASSNSTAFQAINTLLGTYDSAAYNYANRAGINWQDEILGKPVNNQYHKIGVSGGTRELRYNMFYSRNISDGVLINSGATKDIAKLTLTNNVGKKAVVTAIVNYSNQKITGTGGTAQGGNQRLSFLQTLLQYPPVNRFGLSDVDLLDDAVYEFDNQDNPAFQAPTVALESRQQERILRDLNTTANVRYNIMNHLTYTGQINYTNQFGTSKFFSGPSNILSRRNGGPFGNVSTNSGYRLGYNNVLNYANTFAKHNKFDISLGQEYQYGYQENLNASATNFPDINNGWYDLGAGTVPGFPSTSAAEQKLFSLFSRANYSYKGRYMFSASIRRDGSSKFGAQNRFGYFPSASAAWRIVDEAFMKKQDIFSELKLRASYGTSGNNRIPDYAAFAAFVTGNYGLSNNIDKVVYQSRLANENLQWESVVQSNIGLDMGFFKQRITLTAEAYDNRSKNLLYNTRIPASVGFTSQLQNIGETSSRGLEFTLNSSNIKSKSFTWNTDFNIAFNRTKVIKLNGEETSLLVTSYNSAISDFILEVGRPVGIMYGFISDGLYQVDDFNYNSTTRRYTLKPGVVDNGATNAPGYAKYKDISGPDGTPDGIINDFDRTAIGNANPKYTGGINNVFSYKGIDLSVFLDFTVGNDIYNANVANNWNKVGDLNSSMAFHTQRWTYINADGIRVTDPVELAALNVGKNHVPTVNGTSRVNTQLVIEDGSFLRLNNISLGYSFPKTLLRKARISNARIYFTAYNLYVLTKYSGYDPEVSVINNPLTRGVDFSAYPRAKSFVAGINLSL